MKKKISLLVLICLFCQLFSFSGTNVQASLLDDLKKQQQEAQKSLEDLKKKQQASQKEAKELEDAKKKLEKSLGTLDSELYRLTDSLHAIQQEIALMEDSLALTEAELAEAKALEEKQYEEMKLRIKYMYESGDVSIWSMMTGASSFSDFLNRAEYVTAINRYDRGQMDAYLENLDAIEKKKQELEKQQEELMLSKEKMESKQEELQIAINRTKKKVDAAGTAVNSNKDEQAELQKKIAAMEEYERQLNEQRAKEEEKRLAEMKRQEAELAAGTPGPMEATAEEEYLLACIIYCEAGAECYEGQLGVGSVVLNRVRSKYYPNDITSVIYQPGQFSPSWSGRLALTLERGPSASCKKAAREVLDGHIIGPWIGFCYPSKPREGTVIGNIKFF